MGATSTDVSGGGDVVPLSGEGPMVGSSAGGDGPMVGSSSGCDGPMVGSSAGGMNGCSTVFLTGIGDGMNTLASGRKSDSGGSSPSSRNAGFNLSMLTFLWSFPIETVKYFSVLWTTRKGPSYGGCKLFFTASTRIKTCRHLFKSPGMKEDRGPRCRHQCSEFLI